MIAVLLLCAALIGALTMCIYCYHVSFYASNSTPMDPYGPHHGKQYLAYTKELRASTRIMEQASVEDVTTVSHDGLTLHGHYYHQLDGAPLMILMHGYRSMYLRDCAGGYILGTAMGMNVLAIDQRAHGKSDGHTISFGILERKDCLCWIQFANQRFGSQTPIVLYGLSMGAATVLMATDQPLPSNVVAVIADCPYASPREIIRKVCKDRGHSPILCYPFIRLAGQLFGHFDTEESSAMEALMHTTIPILLLHGEDDRFVPCDMSRALHDAFPAHTTLVTFPGAGHGLAYVSDPERYEKACFHFLNSIEPLKAHLSDCKIAQNLRSCSNDI